jgi:hypothetical protein
MSRMKDKGLISTTLVSSFVTFLRQTANSIGLLVSGEPQGFVV